MSYDIKYLPINQLKINPDNPRIIKNAAFKRLVKSLSDMPSLLDARPCICSDRTGELIILGGNMRYLAAKELEYKEVPVIVMSGLTIEQEREIIIKDNGTFGEWVIDELVNSWGDLPLMEWGVNIPDDWYEAKKIDDIKEEYKYEYEIMIKCDDEKQQKELLDQFKKEGFECRPLIF